MRFELWASIPYGFRDIRGWVILQGLIFQSLGCTSRTYERELCSDECWMVVVWLASQHIKYVWSVDGLLSCNNKVECWVNPCHPTHLVTNHQTLWFCSTLVVREHCNFTYDLVRFTLFYPQPTCMILQSLGGTHRRQQGTLVVAW